MNTTPWSIFNDGLGRFGPLTDLRPPQALRTGALTTLERLTRRFGLPPIGTDTPTAADATRLMVNGCWPGVCLQEAVTQLGPDQAICDPEGRVVVALLSPTRVAALLHEPTKVPEGVTAIDTSGRALLSRPWQILEHIDEALRQDIAAMELPVRPVGQTPDGVVVLGQHPVKVAADARLHPMTVLNAEKGPIAIDSHAVIGSFTVVAGPCYIGQHTILQPHTHLRPGSSIGPHCLLGGEVSHSVIQGHSNKAHAGYLGNSILGQWINLGGDTNVSNVKNTYGTVRVQLEADGESEETGQFRQGPIIGDYVRTAIGSRLLTGSVVGTGAMLALSGFAPKLVARLAFLTDDAAQTYDMDKFIVTARRMMARRSVELAPELEKALRNLAR